MHLHTLHIHHTYSNAQEPKQKQNSEHEKFAIVHTQIPLKKYVKYK